MSDDKEFGRVIALLEARYLEAQKLADKELAALNIVREAAGLQPRALGIESSTSENGPVLTQIKRDTFYGKKQMTAIREYLEMRRAQGDGPATAREIFDALKAGGYRFETKSDDIAMISLHNLLRKANNVFHKLPGTGSYGLLAWYPNAKPGASDTHKAKKVLRRGRPRKIVVRPPPKPKPKPTEIGWPSTPESETEE